MNQAETCSLCATPLKVLRKWKCHVCGRTICNNCCHREKGVKAFIRYMDQMPNVICNRCLFVRQRSQYSKEELQPIEAEWYDTLLLDSVDIGSETHYDGIQASFFDGSVPDSSSLPPVLPITLTLCNKSSVALELDPRRSQENDIWATVVNPIDNHPMYLQIKYLYVSSSNPNRNSLFQSFRNESIHLEHYAHIFPAVPHPPSHSDDAEVPQEKPLSNDIAMQFGVFSIAVFVVLWCLSIMSFPSLQPKFRSMIIGVFSYVLSIGYPLLQTHFSFTHFAVAAKSIRFRVEAATSFVFSHRSVSGRVVPRSHKRRRDCLSGTSLHPAYWCLQ